MNEAEEWGRGEFAVTTDAARLDLDVVHRWLPSTLRSPAMT